MKLLLEEKYGYKVTKPPKNTFGYDLEIIRNENKSIAVQVKKFKKPVNRPQVQKFMDFMGLFNAQDQFSEGWLISASGFANTAVEYMKSQRVPVVSLGTVFLDSIRWDYLHPESSFQSPQESSSEISSPASSGKPGNAKGAAPGSGNPVVTRLLNKLRRTGASFPGFPSPKNPQANNHKRYYFGIFTNKGGTGKTTVAAHLAGAFALMGYDVILLDLDPQRNLKKLFQNDEDDSSLYVPPLRPGQTGCGIFVLNDREWEDDKSEYNDIEIVICDCNPTLEENPNNLVQEFDYCIVPTTLNPLGIAKNGDVIQRTFEGIRVENSKAQMHVLINCYNENKATRRRNELLLDLLKEKVDFDEDKKFYLIDPNICAIHHSVSLYYWGMHIVEKKEPQLAFELFGGRCVPGDDFLKLTDYFRERFEEPQ